MLLPYRHLSTARLTGLHGPIVSKNLNERKPFPWTKCIVLGAILLLVARTIWLLPRTHWSVTDVSRAAGTGGNLSRTAITAETPRNIVLISIDTCRADHLGCYGYSRKTSPNVDALAAEGVLFNHAVAPVPITLPSHSSMLTGTIPPYHKVRDNVNYRLAGANVTLAEILRENGFVTGAVVGAFVLNSRFGLDQGFDTYDDKISKTQRSTTLFYSNERKAEDVTYAANTWLERHRDDKFFLFLHYYDPHFPYDRHKRFSFKTLPFLAPSKKDRYDGEVAYTDYWVGQVIKKLKDLGLYGSTMIVLTGDHGEGLGQHSELSHSYFIYHSTLHVPLIIKAPGWPEGERIDNVAGLIDIVPTVCGALGIPVPPGVHGRDLSAFFSNNGAGFDQRYLFCESLYPTKLDWGPFLGLIGSRWKYIHTSSPELYDLVEDPLETRNLLNHRPRQGRVMQEKLELILQRSSVNAVADGKVGLDDEARKRLQSLGYISTRTVDENIQFGQERQDPKKFIGVHNFIERFHHLRLTKRCAEAKRPCQDLLDKWPDMKALHYYLGIIAVYEKDVPAIITNFSRYVEYMESGSDRFDTRIQPKHELALAHGNLAAALQDNGQIEEAIPHYKKALSYDPCSVESNYNLGSAYFNQGKIPDAMRYYTKTLQLDPNFPEAHFMIGNVSLIQKKFDRAVIHFEKAVTLRPNWPQARECLNTAKTAQKRTTKGRYLQQ